MWSLFGVSCADHVSQDGSSITVTDTSFRNLRVDMASVSSEWFIFLLLWGSIQLSADVMHVFNAHKSLVINRILTSQCKSRRYVNWPWLASTRSVCASESLPSQIMSVRSFGIWFSSQNIGTSFRGSRSSVYLYKLLSSVDTAHTNSNFLHVCVSSRCLAYFGSLGSIRINSRGSLSFVCLCTGLLVWELWLDITTSPSDSISCGAFPNFNFRVLSHLIVDSTNNTPPILILVFLFSRGATLSVWMRWLPSCGVCSKCQIKMLCSLAVAMVGYL